MNLNNLNTIYYYQISMDTKGEYVFITDHNKVLNDIDEKLLHMTEYKDAKELLDRIKLK